MFFYQEENMPILNSENRIEIHGGLVRHIEEKVIRECTTEDFLENMRLEAAKMNMYRTSVLPKQCLAYQMTKSVEVFVVEINPRAVSIKFKQGKTSAAAEMELHRLSLPFVQVYVSITRSGGLISEVRLSCTKLPVESMDQQVFVLPLPNQYEGGHGHVCTGDIRVPGDMSTPKKIRKLVEDYFTSAFNTDLSTNYPESLRFQATESASLRGIAGWSKNTEANAMFGISDDVQYEPHKRINMAGIMDVMTRNDI